MLRSNTHTTMLFSMLEKHCVCPRTQYAKCSLPKIPGCPTASNPVCNPALFSGFSGPQSSQSCTAEEIKRRDQGLFGNIFDAILYLMHIAFYFASFLLSIVSPFYSAVVTREFPQGSTKSCTFSISLQILSYGLQWMSERERVKVQGTLLSLTSLSLLYAYMQQ